MTKRPATVGLLALLIFMWLVAEFSGGSTNTAVLARLGARRSLMGFPEENWRLLASLFLHFGVLHLVGNCVMLVAAGYWLEPALGSTRMVFLFLWSGYTANLISSEMSSSRALGASGAALAWVGALLLLTWTRPASVDDEMRWRLRLFCLLAIGLTLGSAGTSLPIDHVAHYAGLGCGLVYGALQYFDSRPGLVEGLLLIASGVAAGQRPPGL